MPDLNLINREGHFYRPYASIPARIYSPAASANSREATCCRRGSGLETIGRFNPRTSSHNEVAERGPGMSQRCTCRHTHTRVASVGGRNREAGCRSRTCIRSFVHFTTAPPLSNKHLSSLCVGRNLASKGITLWCSLKLCLLCLQRCQTQKLACDDVTQFHPLQLKLLPHIGNKH